MATHESLDGGRGLSPKTSLNRRQVKYPSPHRRRLQGLVGIKRLQDDSLSYYCSDLQLMVTAAKFQYSIPGEFTLLENRDRKFLMTDYALWEVIVNGDSPPPKRTVDAVEQTYPPTTA
ncbi:hypothetical protein Tco_0711058 [Tanacetum coccineum]